MLVVVSVLVSGCGTHHAATGFCATIRRGNPAFDSTSAADAPRAFAAFDRVVASAPAAVAPNLKIVESFLHLLYTDPGMVAKHPSLLVGYGKALGRVDLYLHRACGVEIPPPGKFL